MQLMRLQPNTTLHFCQKWALLTLTFVTASVFGLSHAAAQTAQPPKAANDNQLIDLEDWHRGMFQNGVQPNSFMQKAIEPLVGSYVVVSGEGPFNQMMSIFFEDQKPWRGRKETRRILRVQFYTTNLYYPDQIGMVTMIPTVDVELTNTGAHAMPNPYSDGGYLDGTGRKDVGVFEESTFEQSGDMLTLKVTMIHDNRYAWGKLSLAIFGNYRSRNESTLTLNTTTGELILSRRALEEHAKPFRREGWAPSDGRLGKANTLGRRFKKFSPKPLDLNTIQSADRAENERIKAIREARARKILPFTTCETDLTSDL
jgi:hypothetical protein